MKRNIVIILTVIVLIVSVWLAFKNISHDGAFTKWSHSTAGIEHFENGKAFYLGYYFRWEGIGSPTLEKIEFIKNDGEIVAKEDDEFQINSFIKTDGFGAVDEEYVISEGINDELLPVKGFNVDQDFHLVLRVKLKDVDVSNDIKMIRITYKKFGVTQFQNISFDDGIIKDK
ncbi:hypothetical protein BKP35_17430 [Anaerobacillus arseniciselenatis]|uniref:Uncharacterized protein n=1 Tax=Anaerobacillus arseniciselenatis TaxID=85682 RepID=A0A1S2LB62_9BACI|nr:hypothetical protein [Anaerobacillus arseniciselenatis]OIJ08805.1 hypothetical protein BKP35_17430 [Anaerobacillus arseniciselenatis]